MKIMHINYGASPLVTGGAIHHMDALASIEQHKGNSVLLFAGGFIDQTTSNSYCIKYKNADGCDVVCAFNTTVSSSDENPLASHFENPILNTVLVKTIQDFSPDIIVFHTIERIGIKAIEFARKFAPIIFWLHNYWILCPLQICFCLKSLKVCNGISVGNTLTPQCQKVCNYLADKLYVDTHLAKRVTIFKEVLNNEISHFLAVSSIVKKKYEQFGIHSEKISIVPPISKTIISLLQDTNNFSAIPTKKEIINFGFFSGFNVHKGIFVLLDAFTRLPPSIKQKARLHIYGYHLEHLKKILPLHKIPEVTIADKLKPEEVTRKLEEIDVVVIPSIWEEPFSLIAFEALAAGRPIIISDHIGAAEFLPEREFIIRCQAGSIPALQNAITRVVQKLPSFSKEEVKKILPYNIENYYQTVYEYYLKYL